MREIYTYEYRIRNTEYRMHVTLSNNHTLVNMQTLELLMTLTCFPALVSFHISLIFSNVSLK